MSFVNEKISKEDVDKFRIIEIDNMPFVGKGRSRQWTVDRERDIYLRLIASLLSTPGGQEEGRDISDWSLYYKGEVIFIKLEALEYRDVFGAAGWRRFSILEMKLPEKLIFQSDQIKNVLKEALEVYKDAGLYSGCKTFTVEIEG